MGIKRSREGTGVHSTALLVTLMLGCFNNELNLALANHKTGICSSFRLSIGPS